MNALAAIQGEESVPRLSSRYGIHPTQINSWKRYLIEQAAELFAGNDGAGRDKERSIDDLHRFIGQLTVEPKKQLNLAHQCQLLDLSRLTYYYRPQPIDDDHLVLLRKMDEQYLKTPQYVSRSYGPGFSAKAFRLAGKRRLHDENVGYHQHSPKIQNQHSRQATYDLSLPA